MIKIDFFKDGYKVEGHAEYEEYGKDIVCSAVSAIAIGSLNWFNKNCKILDYKINESKPYVEIQLELDESSKIGLSLVKSQLYEIYKSYKTHLSFKEKNKSIKE